MLQTIKTSIKKSDITVSPAISGGHWPRGGGGGWLQPHPWETYLDVPIYVVKNLFNVSFLLFCRVFMRLIDDFLLVTPHLEQAKLFLR